MPRGTVPLLDGVPAFFDTPPLAVWFNVRHTDRKKYKPLAPSGAHTETGRTVRACSFLDDE